MPKIGIIGGSGVYDPEIFENVEKKKINTPYGSPSDFVTLGTVNGVEVAFLPRHGEEHTIPPHKVNYRANIHAFNDLGIEKILSLSAVGSLNKDISPGDFVLSDQFIDETKNRDYTFFDGPKVAHIQIGDEPFCPELRSILEDHSNANNGGTVVVIEGPRFSTKAESKVWKDVYNADV
ncbi:MAG: S-methyl-5'-thioadenosine phosphorylase, partial [archaeon]